MGSDVASQIQAPKQTIPSPTPDPMLPPATPSHESPPLLFCHVAFPDIWAPRERTGSRPRVHSCHATRPSSPTLYYYIALTNSSPTFLSLSLFPIPPRRLGIPPPTLTSGPHLSSSPPPPPLAGRHGDEGPCLPPLPAPAHAFAPCAADPSGPLPALIASSVRPPRVSAFPPLSPPAAPGRRPQRSRSPAASVALRSWFRSIHHRGIREAFSAGELLRGEEGPWPRACSPRTGGS